MSEAMVERWVGHPPVKVWRALTEPRLAARWLPFEGYEAVVGHRFSAAGPTGQAQCKVIAVEPPNRVTLAWSEPGQAVSTVVLELVEEGGGTRVSVRHEGLPAASTRRLHGFWLAAMSRSLDGVLLGTAVAPAGIASVGLAVWGGVGALGLAAVAALWLLVPSSAQPESSGGPPDEAPVTAQVEARPGEASDAADAPEPPSERGRRPLVREAGDVGPLPAAAPEGSVRISSTVVYEREMPTTLHPLYPRTDVDRRTQRLVFDPLFTRSAITTEIRSEVFSAVESIGSRLRVTLIEGLHFHDGHLASAEDVCFSVRTVLDPQLPSPLPFRRRGDLVGCEVVSPQVADLVFRQAFPDARQRAAIPLLPAHAFELQPDGEPSARPIGTGPYIALRGRRSVQLKAFDNPHHRPQMRKFSITEGGDPFVQVKTLLNGGVAGIIDVAPPNRPDVAASDDVVLKTFDRRSFTYLVMNGAVLPQEVRLAVRDALDRTELCRLAYGATGPLPGCSGVTGPFVESSAFTNRSVREQSSLKAVEEHMAAAGAVRIAGRWHLGGDVVRLQLGVSEDVPMHRFLQDVVVNQLVAAGFVVERTSDNAFQRATLWVGEHHVDLTEDPRDLVARTRYDGRSTAVDALLQAAGDAKTDTEQQDAYHDLHARVFSEALVVPLVEVKAKSAWHTSVRNNTISPMDYWGEVDGWQIAVDGREASEPTTDGACLDLEALERNASRGRLSPKAIRCLRQNDGRSPSWRRRSSKLVLKHAFAAGDMELWEEVATAHLDYLDPDDAELAYQLALRLSVGGVGRAEEVIRWSDVALRGRIAWTGERYRSRLVSLHELRTEAAHALWLSATRRHARSPSERTAGLVEDRGTRTVQFAQSWIDVAKASGHDELGAQQVCRAAARDASRCAG